MMSYENNLQMHMVLSGLREGERRGRMKALRDVAYHMSDLGMSFDAIAKCLDLSPMNLRYLLNCTDWDIEGCTVYECRINEPQYRDS